MWGCAPARRPGQCCCTECCWMQCCCCCVKCCCMERRCLECRCMKCCCVKCYCNDAVVCKAPRQAHLQGVQGNAVVWNASWAVIRNQQPLHQLLRPATTQSFIHLSIPCQVDQPTHAQVCSSSFVCSCMLRSIDAFTPSSSFHHFLACFWMH